MALVHPVSVVKGKKGGPSCLNRSRASVGAVMSHVLTEIAIVVVIIGYAVLVVVDLTLGDEEREAVEFELWLIDLIILLLFALELGLKLFAFGLVYLKNGWNLFDGIVIALTIVFAVLEKLLSSLVLLRILRLRSVLRLFRLIVVFNRFKQTTDALKRLRARNARNSNLESPLERALHILHDLTLLQNLSEAQKDGIESVIQMLTSGRLYAPAAIAQSARTMQAAGTSGDAVDSETSTWLRQEYMPTAKKDHRREMTIDEEEVLEAGFGSDYDSDMSDSDLEAGVQRRASVHSGAGSVHGMMQSMSKKQLAMAKTKSFQVRVSRFAKSGDFMSQLRLVDAVHRTGMVSAAPDEGEGAGAGAGVGAGGVPGQQSDRQSKSRLVMLKLRQLTQRAVRMEKLLGRVNDWSFNVFEAADVSCGSPLFVVAANLLQVHGCVSAFNIDVATLHTLLHKIEDGYVDTSYHNSTHAADVTQTVSYFVSKPFLLPYVKPVEVLGSLLAAAVHDYKHPGVNNAFLVATKHDIAITYNDKSVLEAMHVASFFQLIKDPTYNAFDVLEPVQYTTMRSLMVEMVLGTDMAHHFEEVAKFKSKLLQTEHIESEDDTRLFLRLALHTADVSNPAKPLVFAKKWAELIVVEFFAQGDQEHELGLPISTFMDRTKANMPKLQSGFISFIVAPLFDQWASVVPEVEAEVMPFLRVNKTYWAQRQEAEERAASRRRGSVTSVRTSRTRRSSRHGAAGRRGSRVAGRRRSGVGATRRSSVSSRGPRSSVDTTPVMSPVSGGAAAAERLGGAGTPTAREPPTIGTMVGGDEDTKGTPAPVPIRPASPRRDSLVGGAVK